MPEKKPLGLDCISVGELIRAEKAFNAEIGRMIASGESKEIIMKCAIGAVWTAARRYERGKDGTR